MQVPISRQGSMLEWCSYGPVNTTCAVKTLFSTMGLYEPTCIGQVVKWSSGQDIDTPTWGYTQNANIQYNNTQLTVRAA